MLDKLKSLIPSISLFSLISGIIIGYLLRTPIGWILGIIRFLLKL